MTVSQYCSPNQMFSDVLESSEWYILEIATAMRYFGIRYHLCHVTSLHFLWKKIRKEREDRRGLLHLCCTKTVETALWMEMYLSLKMLVSKLLGTPLELWKDRVSSWGSADPAVGAEVSHWLPPDHCVLLESCTKKSSVCPCQYQDWDSILLAHGLLSSLWLLFNGEAADAVVSTFLNNCSITPWSAAQLQDFPPRESLVHQNQWWISQPKRPTSAPGFGKNAAVWQQGRHTARKWCWLMTDMEKSALLCTDGTEDKAFVNTQKTCNMDTYSDSHTFIVRNNKAECDLLGFVRC